MALDVDRPAVHLDDAPDDREAQAAAAPAGLARARATEEPIEDPRQLVRVDPDAGVRDPDRRAAVARPADADPDRPAPWRELQRVADEVRHDLPDPDRVVANSDRLGRDVGGQLDATATSRRGGLLDRRFDGRADVVRAQIEQDEAGVELRELEEVLGQPVEPLQLGPAGLEELGPRV